MIRRQLVIDMLCDADKANNPFVQGARGMFTIEDLEKQAELAKTEIITIYRKYEQPL